jgi:hypothetical protein
MKISFYLRYPMGRRKNSYGKVLFKLFLSAIYFGFFTVQIFLRYTSPQSQQSLCTNNVQYTSTVKSTIAKNILSRKDSKKNKTLCYLNKRYHPKEAIIILMDDFNLHCVYSENHSRSYFSNNYIPHIKIPASYLRGPPAIS